MLDKIISHRCVFVPRQGDLLNYVRLISRSVKGTIIDTQNYLPEMACVKTQETTIVPIFLSLRKPCLRDPCTISQQR